MNRIIFFGGLFIVCTGIFMGMNRQGPADLNIRFVDVDKVVHNSREFHLGLKRLNERLKTIETELKTQKEQMKKVRSELANLKPGTSEYDKKILEFRLIEAKIKYLQEKGKAMASRDQIKLQNYVYDKIREAVKNYAMAKRLKAVLMIREFKPKDVKQFSIQKTLEDNFLRVVLWHDPKLDISNDIIKIINS